jgi:hypothetical protein
VGLPPIPLCSSLHFGLSSRLLFLSVQCLLDPPPVLLNRVYVRLVEGCGINIIPCLVRHLAQQLEELLWPYGELPSSINNSSVEGRKARVTAAKASRISWI